MAETIVEGVKGFGALKIAIAGIETMATEYAEDYPILSRVLLKLAAKSARDL